MDRDYLLFGVGNALLDIIINTHDENIERLGLRKGTMKLITIDELANLAPFIESNANRALIPAGSVGNSAKITALLNQKAVFFGTVGKDENGRAYEEGMRNTGVYTCLKKLDSSPTGICLSLITPDGERTMLTFLGAAGELDTSVIDPELFNKTQFLYIEGYQFTHQKGIDTITAMLKNAKETGVRTAFDLSDPFVATSNKEKILEILDMVDILFANEIEAESFSGTKDPDKSIAYLKTLVGMPVIKLGARGSMAFYRGRIFYRETRSIKPLDTTGAGDSYSAGFLTGLANGMDIEECLHLGNRIAGEMVKIYGTELKKNQVKDIVTEFGL